jgi:hypothetical protein
VFGRPDTLATLHAGDFQLPLDDRSSFGSRSTAAMPASGAFVALVEYRAGAGLRPGKGLFASRRIALPLDPTRFAATGLAHPRPGQAGLQHFFTQAGRPFCLYVVIAGARTARRHHLALVDRMLRSLRIVRREP